MVIGCLRMALTIALRKAQSKVDNDGDYRYVGVFNVHRKLILAENDVLNKAKQSKV